MERGEAVVMLCGWWMGLVHSSLELTVGNNGQIFSMTCWWFLRMCELRAGQN